MNFKFKWTLCIFPGKLRSFLTKLWGKYFLFLHPRWPLEVLSLHEIFVTQVNQRLYIDTKVEAPSLVPFSGIPSASIILYAGIFLLSKAVWCWEKSLGISFKTRTNFKLGWTVIYVTRAMSLLKTHLSWYEIKVV